MKSNGFVREPARDIPVAYECDVCVIGGSCTGVFAAVRAARLGASVCIVEHNIIFGGMATAAMVNDWHCVFDVHGRDRIIAGLTLEMTERLKMRDAIAEVEPPPARIQYRFASAEMAGELDRMVVENNIRAFLCTKFVATVGEGGKIDAAIIEDKSGRRAIRAEVFIDASGDGDLVRRSGFEAYQSEQLQPVTYVALMGGLRELPAVWKRIQHLAPAYDYPLANGFPWIHKWLGSTDASSVYGPRLNGVDASDADVLSATLLEARRLHRAIADMTYEEFKTRVNILCFAHALGVRETLHARCLHQLTGEELLSGTPYPDAIANGIYPVDIHYPGGTLLRFLDGTEHDLAPSGKVTYGRWRDENTPTPKCYHVPYRSLVPRGSKNVLVAGRVLDADRSGFAGVRVMVNMNQTGEAAGTAAYLALSGGTSVADVDCAELRKSLAAGGSIVL
ncbi:FAD-dependent oxidoreductase [soil metagenome]